MAGSWLGTVDRKGAAAATHFWVELPGDVVFESVTQEFYSRRSYYNTIQPQAVRSYSPEELAAALGVELRDHTLEEADPAFQEPLLASCSIDILANLIERERLRLRRAGLAPTAALRQEEVTLRQARIWGPGGSR